MQVKALSLGKAVFSCRCSVYKITTSKTEATVCVTPSALQTSLVEPGCPSAAFFPSDKRCHYAVSIAQERGDCAHISDLLHSEFSEATFSLWFRVLWKTQWSFSQLGSPHTEAKDPLVGGVHKCCWFSLCTLPERGWWSSADLQQAVWAALHDWWQHDYHLKKAGNFPYFTSLNSCQRGCREFGGDSI